MNTPTRKPRCAIYTRKSSDEGLDQSFNSLDAQREACAAYIASQRHEGWKALPKHYDDGGYSGGNTNRPALQALLQDIAAGQVDLVVVYKIDRLTRSLMDFAKMVEVFDRHSTSFVSVTQHFNTTTSMGRLTLNVLLSFAQFEREVTGERIRDKIAASKQKGLWMGGPVPLGYDVKDRALVVNRVEARRVLDIFERYRKLGCVRTLKEQLDLERFRTKRWVSKKGTAHGGHAFSRGLLYAMLRNHIYRGEVHHAGQYHPGKHAAIVPEKLWDAVQQKLDSNRNNHKLQSNAREPSLLAGMVFTQDGTPLIPSHTVKDGRRYRYYTHRSADGRSSISISRPSIPAYDLEGLIGNAWCKMLSELDAEQFPALNDSEWQGLRAVAFDKTSQWSNQSMMQKRCQLLSCDAKVVADSSRVTFSVDMLALQQSLLGARASVASEEVSHQSSRLTRTMNVSLYKMSGGTRFLEPGSTSGTEAASAASDHLLRLVAVGRRWAADIVDGNIDSITNLARRENHAESHIYDVLRMGTLAPNLIDALLKGKSLRNMELSAIGKGLPIDWAAQATTFS